MKSTNTATSLLNIIFGLHGVVILLSSSFNFVGCFQLKYHKYHNTFSDRGRLMTTTSSNPSRSSRLMMIYSNRFNSSHDDYGIYNNDVKELRPTTSFGSEAVPEGQRPVNEYLDVTSQPLFDWASVNGSKGLLTRLIVLYSIVFGFVCYPIAGATYTMDGYLIQKLAASNVGAIILILILLIRLYSGWYYIGQRLTSKVIEYEETGWYDGAYETKTENEMKRDRFLYNTNVKPVVERLKVFLMSCVGITLASIIIYNIADNAKPIPFDQYDPAMLERLRADDDLALKAASYTGGKPAYCDNRYYQAIANGGQGCN